MVSEFLRIAEELEDYLLWASKPLRCIVDFLFQGRIIAGKTIGLLEVKFRLLHLP
jgi:hypothetical protein